MDAVDILASGATDVGTVRALNEDTLVARHPVYLVADGMGGHEAGDIASELTASVLAKIAELPVVTAADVERALRSAQEAVSALPYDAGSTVSGVIASHTEELGPTWFVVNVGDSRTYRILSGQIQQLTNDHSEVEEMIRLGILTRDQARNHGRRNVITRAMGDGESVGDMWMTPIVPGERILICSDGVSGVLSAEELLRLGSQDSDPASIAEHLIDAALSAGSRDNATALVLQVGEFNPETTAVPDLIPILTVESPAAQSPAGQSPAGQKPATETPSVPEGRDD